MWEILPHLRTRQARTFLPREMTWKRGLLPVPVRKCQAVRTIGVHFLHAPQQGSRVVECEY